MSVQLSNGEKIVRSYDYGRTEVKGSPNFNQTINNLTITNKRIIHSQRGKGLGADSYTQSDMPISSAKYVNVFYKLQRYPIFLLLGLVYFAMALFYLVINNSEDGSGNNITTPCFCLYIYHTRCCVNHCVYIQKRLCSQLQYRHGRCSDTGSFLYQFKIRQYSYT